MNAMHEFVLIFRMDITTPGAQPTAQQMQQYMHHWIAWIQSIAAQNQLSGGGNHMMPSGTVLYPKGRKTQGPYRANKESVAGYIIILAKDMDDAVAIAGKCPILNGEGTSVEVRQTAMPHNMEDIAHR